MIQIVGLTKSFGDHVIFDNLSFEIADGEFVVFSGKSGCGKTTMLNLIGGIDTPDSGQIIVDGTDITKQKNRIEYFRTKVSFLFQNFALIENKTVAENLNMVKKQSRTEVTTEQALKKVGLEDKLNAKVYTLSGGEQQRVALARIMIKQCSIILADEPTGSLDAENAGIVMDILTELNKQGKTVILVTHDESLKGRGSRIINM